MEKANNSQLELFSQVRGSDETQVNPRASLFNSLWRYEKTILIIICFIITGIVSFSLGVEKGRRLANAKMGTSLGVSTQTQESLPSKISTMQQPPRSPVIEKRLPPPQEKEYKGYTLMVKRPERMQGYTIQVASYLAKVNAISEAESFRRKGLNSLVLSKGKYTVLCVGNFTNQKAAQSLLSELKKQKRYKDCYIRRL